MYCGCKLAKRIQRNRITQHLIVTECRLFLGKLVNFGVFITAAVAVTTFKDET
jgi:hypothetical protein